MDEGGVASHDDGTAAPGGRTASAPRILYVISAYSGSTTGNGGHYYSARDVATVLQAEWPGAQVRILVLGDLLPGAVSRAAVSYIHVSPAGKGFLAYWREVLTAADDFSPSIVHAYDNKSYFFARQIARRHGAKRFLTKPGGPDPGVTFPYCPDTVCFSEENLAALRSRRRLRAGRVHLIPERVAFPEPDLARTAALRARVGEGDVLMRICRAGEYHRRSIEQTLALARLMRAEGIPVRAVVVGVAGSPVGGADSGEVFIAEPEFCVDASALLDVATYVVGTGRGAVEAAVRKRWVFVPLADGDLPALLTPANWRTLARRNFSARTRDPGGADPADLTPLKDLLRDTRRAEGFLGELSTALAGAFGPGGIPARYQALYSLDQKAPGFEPVGLLVNAGAFLVPYLRWRRGAAATRKGS